MVAKTVVQINICRTIGPKRLGWAQREPTPREVADILGGKAKEIGASAAYLDGLLWLFGARGYGDICGAVPDCGACGVSSCWQR
jgi:hypothetical protein